MNSADAYYIEELKARIAELEAENTALREKIVQLEKEIEDRHWASLGPL